MSEVTASSHVSSPYVSSPSGAGIAAAAKLVVEGFAVLLDQRALANRAASERSAFASQRGGGSCDVCRQSLNSKQPRAQAVIIRARHLLQSPAAVESDPSAVRTVWL